MQAYKKKKFKNSQEVFRHSAFASDSKTIKLGQGNLNFAKFKLQIIKFLTKFSLQLDKIWFKIPTQTLKNLQTRKPHQQSKRHRVNLASIKMIEFLRNSYL